MYKFKSKRGVSSSSMCFTSITLNRINRNSDIIGEQF